MSADSASRVRAGVLRRLWIELDWRLYWAVRCLRVGTWGFPVVFVLILGIGVALLCFAARQDSATLNRWALLAQLAQCLVGVVAIVPLVWAGVKFRSSAESQRKAKHYQAWQAISSSHGTPGNGARKTALEDLHRDGESLAGVDLAGGALLRRVRLPGADLLGANLEGAQLGESNFERADLQLAKLGDADLHSANLRRADLTGADLRRASLEDTCLEGVTAFSVNLRGANLHRANLRRAEFVEADFAGAEMQGAQLEGANLSMANLSGAQLFQGNLQGATLLRSQLAGANLREADLRGTSLSPDQLCSCSDWRGAVLPKELEAYQLGSDAPEAAMDQLGRRPEEDPFS